MCRNNLVPLSEHFDAKFITHSQYADAFADTDMLFPYQMHSNFCPPGHSLAINDTDGFISHAHAKDTAASKRSAG